MGDLSLHFSKKEFACKDGCGFDTVQPGLIKVLERIRERLRRPVKIVSGCRCAKRNADVDGAKNSAHLRGYAADVKVVGSRERFELVWAALSVGVTRLGIGQNFVHLDIDPDITGSVMWVYE